MISLPYEANHPMSSVESLEAGPKSRRGTPTWEIAELFPDQGEWTEEQYLAIETNRLIEFRDGELEFLPEPTELHQAIVEFLFLALKAFVTGKGLGKVFFAPLRIRLKPDLIREPDVALISAKYREGPEVPPSGADLVMEVISPGKDSRERDEIAKRKDYAEAGIAEYWLVDPQSHKIEVLWLNGSVYETGGTFGAGAIAGSRLLPGFAVSVDAVFAPPPLND